MCEGVRLPSCDQCSPAGPHSAAAAPAPSSYSRTRTASPPTPETGGRKEGSHHPQDIAHPPNTHPHHGFLTPPPPITHTNTQLYTSTPRDRKLEIPLLLHPPSLSPLSFLSLPQPRLHTLPAPPSSVRTVSEQMLLLPSLAAVELHSPAKQDNLCSTSSLSWSMRLYLHQCPLCTLQLL